MARAAIFTDPLKPQMPPAFSSALAGSGEQLTVDSGATYREALESAGLTDCCRVSRGIGGMLPRIVFTGQILPGLLEALRRDPPDYILLDAAALWAWVAAERLAIPAISYREGPAVSRRSFDAELRQRFYGDGVAEYTDAARRIDREYGSHTADLAAAVECRCDCNLVPISRQLQPDAGQFDASYRFVGPCPPEETTPDEFPWHELGPDPLIYLSLEAGDGGETLYRACAEAFGGLPLEVVVRRPGDRTVAENAPRNFRPAGTASPAKLLERTTLAIGGADARAVEASARAGVLQLLHPRDAGEWLLAGRVEQLGAGLRLNAADLEGRRLRQLAGRVIADPSYCRAAEALREALPPDRGAAEACAEILAFGRSVARRT